MFNLRSGTSGSAMSGWTFLSVLLAIRSHRRHPGCQVSIRTQGEIGQFLVCRLFRSSGFVDLVDKRSGCIGAALLW